MMAEVGCKRSIQVAPNISSIVLILDDLTAIPCRNGCLGGRLERLSLSAASTGTVGSQSDGSAVVHPCGREWHAAAVL